MSADGELQRYVYRTQGVCPPEIHFQIQGGLLHEVRFVGGGCPGNAQLVSRLLEGKGIDEILEYLEGISCRNGTSCPDQLATALKKLKGGSLLPTRSFQIHVDPVPRSRVGLVGELGGRVEILRALITAMKKDDDVETAYCLGNLTGVSKDNLELLREIREQDSFLAIQGELDWLYAQGREPPSLPPLEQRERDYLLRLPQVVVFQIGDRKGMGFFGGYLRDLAGFSDYDPYALEINMVCGLSNFLQNEAVFPALRAMTPQFSTQVVVFSELQRWGHWEVGGVDFISLGPAWDGERLSWGLLEDDAEGIRFRLQQVPWQKMQQQ